MAHVCVCVYLITCLLLLFRGKEITACSLERNNVFFGTGDGRLYELDLLSMGITLIE